MPEKAEAGELEALRMLSLLVTTKNTTSDVIDIGFKHLTASSPNPSQEMTTSVRRLHLLARPALALAILWELIGSCEALSPEVKTVLVRHILESGDYFFDWMGSCLRNGVACAPADIVKGRDGDNLEMHLLQAHHLLQLLKLGEECRIVLTSSATFIKLILQLWQA